MMKFVKMLKSEKGFTLIELIFVVIILAVLAGIALVNLGSSEDDAKAAVVKSDMQTIATAIKVYKAKEGSFPATLAALTSDGTKYKAMLDESPVDPYASNSTADPGTSYNYTLASDKLSATITSDCTTATYSKTVK